MQGEGREGTENAYIVELRQQLVWPACVEVVVAPSRRRPPARAPGWGAKNQDQSQTQQQVCRRASIAFACLGCHQFFHIDSAQKHCSWPPALSKPAANPADVSLAKRESETSFEGERVVTTTVPRETGARAFRSMDLNALRRLGFRRQRDDDDQQVLVEHHHRCWLWSELY